MFHCHFLDLPVDGIFLGNLVNNVVERGLLLFFEVIRDIIEFVQLLGPDAAIEALRWFDIYQPLSKLFGFLGLRPGLVRSLSADCVVPNEEALTVVGALPLRVGEVVMQLKLQVSLLRLQILG